MILVEVHRHQVLVVTCWHASLLHHVILAMSLLIFITLRVILVASFLLDQKVIEEVAFRLVFFLEHAFKSVSAVVKGYQWRLIVGILRAIENFVKE